jgi:AraC-like DNA-binding protein
MIGKTRQVDAGRMASRALAARTAFAQGCGVLRHSPSPGSYRHTRYAPAAVLANWVEHFWLESWDLRGREMQTREVLPHPCIHLVFARNRSRIYGVQLSRFVRELKGEDYILGVKFLPGAFYPCLGKPVYSIANTSIPAQQLFNDAADVEAEVLACSDDRGMVEAASRFLVAHLPRRDPNVESARRLVDEIVNDRSMTRVEDLIARCGIQERTLQRLFRRYVGASARWVIKRYRVYEALEHLTVGRPLEWVALAQNLGYYDQAHFINDFKKLVGRSPAEYVKG